MGIWILATVLYGNLLGSALLFSPQNCQHKITQNRVCNAFWWVFEWFSVIVITLEHVGHISLRSNPICSRSDVANRKSSYRLPKSAQTPPKSCPRSKISKCILGAINLHRPLSPCSESIARVERNQKPVFPDVKTRFCWKSTLVSFANPDFWTKSGF